MKASGYNRVNNRANGQLMKGVFAVVDGGRLPCVDYEKI